MKTETSPELEKDIKPNRVVKHSKPEAQIITRFRVTEAIYEIFLAAFKYDSSFFEEGKSLEIKLIEEPDFDEEFGSEYFISLYQTKNADDWIIWGRSGCDPRFEFDDFWIIFSSDAKSKAYKTMDGLQEVFESHYFHSEPKFKIFLRSFLNWIEMEKGKQAI